MVNQVGVDLKHQRVIVAMQPLAFVPVEIATGFHWHEAVALKQVRGYLQASPAPS